MDYNINSIKMIISDIDGVWTDGCVYIGNENYEMKKFNVNDGAGVALLRVSGIMLALISGRKSVSTELRAAELKIEDVYNGTLNKIIPYEELKLKYNLKDSEIAYVGDDLIDIPVMEKVGLSCCPADAVSDVKEIVKYVSHKNGGQGCVREIIEQVLRVQGKWSLDIGAN